jgi:hypothetical protein
MDLPDLKDVLAETIYNDVDRTNLVVLNGEEYEAALRPLQQWLTYPHRSIYVV